MVQCPEAKLGRTRKIGGICGNCFEDIMGHICLIYDWVSDPPLLILWWRSVWHQLLHNGIAFLVRFEVLLGLSFFRYLRI